MKVTAKISSHGRLTCIKCDSGYVALAVAGEKGTVSSELDTGLAGDRQGNMLAFACEALKLVGSFIKGEVKM